MFTLNSGVNNWGPRICHHRCLGGTTKQFKGQNSCATSVGTEITNTTVLAIDLLLCRSWIHQNRVYCLAIYRAIGWERKGTRRRITQCHWGFFGNWSNVTLRDARLSYRDRKSIRLIWRTNPHNCSKKRRENFVLIKQSETFLVAKDTLRKAQICFVVSTSICLQMKTIFIAIFAVARSILIDLSIRGEKSIYCTHWNLILTFTEFALMNSIALEQQKQKTTSMQRNQYVLHDNHVNVFATGSLFVYFCIRKYYEERFN